MKLYGSMTDVQGMDSRLGRKLVLAVFVLLFAGIQGLAQQRVPRDIPTKPFNVIGNIHYVGVTDPSGQGPQDSVAYLITTPEGHILFDTQYEETVPIIRDNIQTLGFRIQDVKIMINSHAHTDHMQGHARMKELTGADVVMSGDGRRGPRRWRRERLPQRRPPALGAPASRSHRPRRREGHPRRRHSDGLHYSRPHQGLHHLDHGRPATAAATTTLFFLAACAPRRMFRCSGTRTTRRLPTNFHAAFAKLKALPCDVFLGAHGSWAGLTAKFRRKEQGASPNPFINPEEYREYIATFEKGVCRSTPRRARFPLSGRAGLFVPRF